MVKFSFPCHRQLINHDHDHDINHDINHDKNNNNRDRTHNRNYNDDGKPSGVFFPFSFFILYFFYIF